MREETSSTHRLRWLVRLLLVWVAAIFLRLLWLQVIQHDDLLRLGRDQQQRLRPIPAMRGTIFDRLGQPLAKTLPAESICVNPQRIPDVGVAADLLAPLLDLDRANLQERIRVAKRRGKGFLWVKRKVTAEQAESVRSLQLDYVEFRPETRRFYAHGTLASQVVGSTGMVDEDDVEKGNAGIEMAFDEALSGRPGLERIYTDVKQNVYNSVVARQPDPGEDITLTIDPNLQYLAEKELDQTVASSHAKTGSIVAMDPYTGEVLAMANFPRFDSNLPPSADEPAGARSNLAITTPFEPGSVFKTVTLSAALETTSLRPDTIINCGNGSINLFGRIIHDHNSYPALSMADVLAKSSNIGAINIGLKVGDRSLYNYVRRFGFGEKTGIDLPGESAGVVRRVDEWTPSSIGSVAMGHEVSATAIQLAVLGAAIANGGFRLRPQIVLARHKPGQPEERFLPEAGTRAIAGETAVTMRQMMEGVVLHGTAKGLANLRGYTSGGKTGSAQIYDSKGHVYTHSYNASFLGFAPVADPRIVIAVTLNGTTGGTAGYGGPVAAPVFREVAMAALRILDVPKDVPDESVSSVTPPPVRSLPEFRRDPGTEVSTFQPLSRSRMVAQASACETWASAQVRRQAKACATILPNPAGRNLETPVPGSQRDSGGDLDRRSFLTGLQRRSQLGL